jgi:hypothetical protein
MLEFQCTQEIFHKLKVIAKKDLAALVDCNLYHQHHVHFILLRIMKFLVSIWIHPFLWGAFWCCVLFRLDLSYSSYWGTCLKGLCYVYWIRETGEHMKKYYPSLKIDLSSKLVSLHKSLTKFTSLDISSMVKISLQKVIDLNFIWKAWFLSFSLIISCG